MVQNEIVVLIYLILKWYGNHLSNEKLCPENDYVLAALLLLRRLSSDDRSAYVCCVKRIGDFANVCFSYCGR